MLKDYGTLWGVHEKPSKHLTVFSPETVKIKQLANLTANTKNRSAMRTRGLMRDSIPFGWNAVLKYQHLGVDLLQEKR